MFDDEVSILTWEIHDKSVDYWTDARLRTIGLSRLIEDGFEALHTRARQGSDRLAIITVVVAHCPDVIAPSTVRIWPLT
jgi:hypothetical protein